MKILFTASLRGKHDYSDKYKLISNGIKVLGHHTLGDDILTSGDEFYEELKKG